MCDGEAPVLPMKGSGCCCSVVQTQGSGGVCRRECMRESMEQLALVIPRSDPPHPLARLQSGSGEPPDPDLSDGAPRGEWTMLLPGAAHDRDTRFTSRAPRAARSGGRSCAANVALLHRTPLTGRCSRDVCGWWGASTSSKTRAEARPSEHNSSTARAAARMASRAVSLEVVSGGGHRPLRCGRVW